MIDVEYYKYTLKRSTYDIFSIVGQGDDIYTLGPQFLVEFWYLTLLFFAFVWLSIFVYNKLENANFKVPDKKRDWIQKSVISLFLLAFIIMGGRGGMQLIPLNIVDAGMFTTAQNVPLVLNTSFTVVRTWGKKGIESSEFFSEEELNRRFVPMDKPTSTGPFQKKNVVVIILESFSMEFVKDGPKANRSTPFIQQLKETSEYYDRCYANGKRSIEALPAILSGIPTLMNEPFISSAYGGNPFESFATYLKPLGYHTSFFHGGKNGTMNFDGFIQAAGFDAYYGKDEYPDKSDYDNSWGIYDEPYLQYYVEQLSSFRQPFMSSVFTLSSHHPYSIPEQHKDRFNQGETPLENTIQYVDFSLERFFKSAEQKDWFKNTVFVITADHTPDTKDPVYQRFYGMYHVPLIIYDPSNEIKVVNSKTCQQLDILPTILFRLNYPEKVFGFGKNINSSEGGYAVQYINNTFQIIKDSLLYRTDLKQPMGLYNVFKDPLLNNELLAKAENGAGYSGRVKELDEELKAIVQSYGQRMTNNQLQIK